MRKIRLLLAKDLRLLGRSPALLAALIVYPLVFAVLVGLVVRYANDRPKVAFVDLDRLPETLTVGGQRFNVPRVISQVQGSVQLVPMDEEDADHDLANGSIVAEIVVPRGFASKLRGMVESPTLVLKTAQGGLSGRVEQQTQALVYSLNRRLQRAYIAANLQYVKLLVEGGQGSFLGDEFDVVGLDRAAEMLDEIKQSSNEPTVVQRAEELSVFVREARLALGASGESLRATANPIELETDTSGGRTWLLSAQLQAYALGLTLAFICVLLAAAALAAERDENVIGRLARGLVRLVELVIVKVLLAVLVAIGLGVVIALLFGVLAEAFGVSGGEPWQRLPLLVLGLALAGAAFGAFGTLVGALARDSRTAVLVAFLVALPLVLLGLVPEGAARAAWWAARFFPFSHAVDFFQASLYDTSPWGTLVREALWLLALVLVFGAAARVAVRRLAA
jgi:ABC-type transport system involved in cytochrome c biogenesis permease component